MHAIANLVSQLVLQKNTFIHCRSSKLTVVD